jgi:hypothetical protein
VAAVALTVLEALLHFQTVALVVLHVPLFTVLVLLVEEAVAVAMQVLVEHLAQMELFLVGLVEITTLMAVLERQTQAVVAVETAHLVVAVGQATLVEMAL